MKRFARLYAELDASTGTLAKVAALRRYFAEAPAADAAWAVYFLAGGKPRQTINARALRDFAIDASGLPAWLFEESYQAVGDLAETIALLLPPPARADDTGLAEWVERRLLPLRGEPPAVQAEHLRRYADGLDTTGRFLLIKLIGGGFRVGVSRLLVTRALAEHAGLEPKLVAQRLVGYTDTNASPGPDAYLALIAPHSPQPSDLPAASARSTAGTPYPFFLAQQLDAPVASLGDVGDWFVEWKYDGIRAQLVRRAGSTWLWSRGEDLITDRFPEVVAAAEALPTDVVLDGEVLIWDDSATQPASFARLQTRITRKTVGSRLLREHPARFVAYDLLEDGGVDVRELPQLERRQRLEARIAGAPDTISLSPRVVAPDWAELARLRAASRARGVEGFMLKHRDARYGVGRTRESGAWWKWKIDPMTVDAVLVYAQRGHGRRASLYTDYTFAVWDRAPRDAAEVEAVCAAIAGAAPPRVDAPQLVPFAKAYSGLTDHEIRQVDAVIRRTTVEKFGPVRTVVPTLVFELGFEGIQRSRRHRSGIAVRFPRMLRWRTDKPLHEADTLASLQRLLEAAGG